LRWEAWKPHYQEIALRLNLDTEADQRATETLHQLLADTNPKPMLQRLESIIKGNDVVVCGAGPSLHRHLEVVTTNPKMSQAVFVAADGATSAFLEIRKTCDIIVTDLDGDRNDIGEMIQEGALAIVHAHGDNIPTLETYVPEVLPVLGSTQVKPTSRVFLWGGFTDGDRACFLVSHYSPRRIILAGMDFGCLVGRWSKPDKHQHFAADAVKQAKLGIAKQLITNLQQQSNTEYTLLN
jgi:hypothetical protein